MCYSIPGRVVAIEGSVATIDYFGEEKRAFVAESGTRQGDFVYAQAGIVVQKIPQKEALDVLEKWRELFFQLKQKDAQASATFCRTGDKIFDSILENAAAGAPPSKEEAFYLLNSNESNKIAALCACANEVRQKTLKNSCCVHGIIEFSNQCVRDCAYCGIGASNNLLERYAMSVEEIVDAARRAVNELGFKALVLQSGEKSLSLEDLCEAVTEIRKSCGAVIFISAGDFSKNECIALYGAGARGMLLRFETSNPKLHLQLRGYPLEKRLQAIRNALDAGFILATGSLIGLQNQSAQDIANDVFLAKELRAEMFSFGPLITHPSTPMACAQKPDLNGVLKLLATSRLVQQDSKILVTTALEALHPEARRRGLLAGANSLMIDATPLECRKKYDLYPGKFNATPVEQQISKTIELLHELGRAPTDLGASIRGVEM